MTKKKKSLVKAKRPSWTVKKNKLILDEEDLIPREGEVRGGVGEGRLLEDNIKFHGSSL